MTELHQFVAAVAVAGSVGLLLAAVWSFVTGRRSAGQRDHWLAVDRLILFTMGAIAVAAWVGIGLVVGGAQPADGLHLLYGPAAFVAPALGWWYGGRRPAGTGGPADADGRTSPDAAPRRTRRDAWIIVATVVLLGIELRLFATG